MELTADIIFLFLSSVNNDLFIYLFIYLLTDLFIYLFIYLYIRTTESTNISYISVQLMCPTAITNYHHKMF